MVKYGFGNICERCKYKKTIACGIMREHYNPRSRDQKCDEFSPKGSEEHVKETKI